MYLALALPLTANALVDSLPAAPVTTKAEFGDIKTLFIFDGDNRRGRARQAAEVARLAKLDAAWLLGADYMLDDLMFAGFPPGLLRRDASAPNTKAQLAQVERLAGSQPGPVGILASRLSIPRIEAFARAAGFRPVLIAAPLDEEPAHGGVGLLIPSYGALMASRDAIYEHGALHYYRTLGVPPVDAQP
jgi:hypothetical protein